MKNLTFLEILTFQSAKKLGQVREEESDKEWIEKQQEKVFDGVRP